MLEERSQVRVLIVGNSVLPATKYDADPFESQCSHGRMVGVALTALLLVVNSCPFRLDDGMTRPFMKALPQKLGAGPTEMYPLPFPAAFCHRGDSAEGLDLACTAVTLPLRAKRCQQTRRHYSTCSGQRIKDEKIWMRCRRLLDLPIQILNALDEDTDELNDHFHGRAFGLNHCPILNGREGSTDRFDSALDPFSIPTPVLAKESAQARRRSLL
jgi:hypothetical protein